MSMITMITMKVIIKNTINTMITMRMVIKNMKTTPKKSMIIMLRNHMTIMVTVSSMSMSGLTRKMRK